MLTKGITYRFDEIFPCGIYLAAIEPVSNFIILKEITDKRDSSTWEQAMSKCLDVLPVNVIQVASDCTTALIKYTEHSLRANHLPDLFHSQQDISKGTSAPSCATLKSLKMSVEQCESSLVPHRHEKKAYERFVIKPIGHSINYDSAILEAEIEYGDAIIDYDLAKQRYDDMFERIINLTKQAKDCAIYFINPVPTWKDTMVFIIVSSCL